MGGGPVGARARVPAACGGGDKPEAGPHAPPRPVQPPPPPRSRPPTRLPDRLRPPGSTGGAGGGECGAATAGALIRGAAAGAGAEGRSGLRAGSLRREHLPPGSGAAEAGRPGAIAPVMAAEDPGGFLGSRVEGAGVWPRSYARGRGGLVSSLPVLVSAVGQAGFRSCAPEWADSPRITRGGASRPLT